LPVANSLNLRRRKKLPAVPLVFGASGSVYQKEGKLLFYCPIKTGLNKWVVLYLKQRRQYAGMSGTSQAAPHVAGLLLINGTNLHFSATAKNDTDGSPDKIAIK
jgi:hypothetical protein